MSDLSDEIKRDIFQAAIGLIYFTVWMHYMDADEMYREKTWLELHNNATGYIWQVLEPTPHKTTVVRPPTSSL